MCNSYIHPLLGSHRCAILYIFVRFIACDWAQPKRTFPGSKRQFRFTKVTSVSSQLRRKKMDLNFRYFNIVIFFLNFVFCFSTSFIVSSTSIHVYSTSTSVRIFFFHIFVRNGTPYNVVLVLFCGTSIACVAGGIRGHKGSSLKYHLPKN